MKQGDYFGTGSMEECLADPNYRAPIVIKSTQFGSCCVVVVDRYLGDRKVYSFAVVWGEYEYGNLISSLSEIPAEFVKARASFKRAWDLS